MFGQIGTITNSENNCSFVADYLIFVKENFTNKKDITFLDDYFKEKKNIDDFYQKIYGNNSEKIFEIKIFEKIILSVLNYKRINALEKTNSLDSYGNKNNTNNYKSDINININVNKNFKRREYYINNKTNINNRKEINIIQKENKTPKKDKFPLRIKNNIQIINFNEAYIIKNEIINKLSQIYNRNEVLAYLNSNHQLNGINYNNFDQNFNEISKYLNENQINYINSIKQKDREIKLKEKEGFLDIKQFNNDNNLIYIDNFEIIDKNFANYLNQIFGNSIMIYKVDYAKIEKKLFLIINLNQNHIFEIARLNENDNIIVEYLIEIVKNDLSNDINKLSNCICRILLENGLQQMISLGNPINFENNLFINLHAINNNL